MIQLCHFMQILHISCAFAVTHTSFLQAVERAGAVDSEGGWFNSVTGFLGKAFYW